VSRVLGPVGGWKVGIANSEAEPSCAPVYRDCILGSGAVLPSAQCQALSLEIEFAFLLRRDLPGRSGGYRPDEIAQAVDFVPLIEVIGSRYRDPLGLAPAELLADANGNRTFILGGPVARWRDLDFRTVRVELAIDDRVVQSACGTHPAGDPIRLVVWLADHVAARCGGLKSGEVVTTGSLQGATPIAAGSRAIGTWGSWGRVAVEVAL
jgi:2-keto-4-pentenoate hydratase